MSLTWFHCWLSLPLHMVSIIDMCITSSQYHSVRTPHPFQMIFRYTLYIYSNHPTILHWWFASKNRFARQCCQCQKVQTGPCLFGWELTIWHPGWHGWQGFCSCWNCGWNCKGCRSWFSFSSYPWWGSATCCLWFPWETQPKHWKGLPTFTAGSKWAATATIQHQVEIASPLDRPNVFLLQDSFI